MLLNQKPHACVVLLILLTVSVINVNAQQAGINYDESKVLAYTLPDPLLLAGGAKVTSARTWWRQRRPEILRLFEQHVYGKAPGRPKGMRFETKSIDQKALDGKATRKEVAVYFTGRKDGPKMDILIYLPNNQLKPVPTLLGLNFYGNHSIHKDPGITLSEGWMSNSKEFGVVNNRATESSRGVRANRWPVERIIARGYALATIYYGDLDPDFDDGFKNGVHPLFYQEGQAVPAPEEWGSIAAWAWGLSTSFHKYVWG